MIMADHHHTNPVLVCFCHLLLKHTLEGLQEDGYSRLNRGNKSDLDMIRRPVMSNYTHFLIFFYLRSVLQSL